VRGTTSHLMISGGLSYVVFEFFTVQMNLKISSLYKNENIII